MLGSNSISGQLSSMVELTKYAMDAMGLESDSRVTFSQITKYREKLNTEFNTAVKEGLEKLGVSDPSSVTFIWQKMDRLRPPAPTLQIRPMFRHGLKAMPPLARICARP